MARRPGPRSMVGRLLSISPAASPRSAVLPRPSWPLALRPQHLRRPVSRVAHVWVPPAVMAVAVRRCRVGRPERCPSHRRRRPGRRCCRGRGGRSRSPPAFGGAVVEHRAGVGVAGGDGGGGAAGAETDGGQAVAHLAHRRLGPRRRPGRGGPSRCCPALGGSVVQQGAHVAVAGGDGDGGAAGAERDGREGIAHLAGVVAAVRGAAGAEPSVGPVAPALDGAVVEEGAGEPLPAEMAMAVRPVPRETAGRALPISPALSPRAVTFPRPSWPEPLLPQHFAVPSSSTAQVWLLPALTDVATRPVPRLTAGRLSPISPAASPRALASPRAEAPRGVRAPALDLSVVEQGARVPGAGGSPSTGGRKRGPRLAPAPSRSGPRRHSEGVAEPEASGGDASALRPSCGDRWRRWCKPPAASSGSSLSVRPSLPSAVRPRARPSTSLPPPAPTVDQLLESARPGALAQHAIDLCAGGPLRCRRSAGP